MTGVFLSVSSPSTLILFYSGDWGVHSLSDVSVRQFSQYFDFILQWWLGCTQPVWCLCLSVFSVLWFYSTVVIGVYTACPRGWVSVGEDCLMFAKGRSSWLDAAVGIFSISINPTKITQSSKCMGVTYTVVLNFPTFIVNGAVLVWGNVSQGFVNISTLRCYMYSWWWCAFIDWLIIYGFKPLKTCSLIWRRHHCRWRAAKFRPMLDAQGL
jgi:hypothetical protein